MDEPAALSLVRNKRVTAQLSQADLAARVGVSRQTLNAIETGRQIPSTTLALQLARALRCTVDALFRLPGGASERVRLADDQPTGTRVAVGRVDGALVGHRCQMDARAADGFVLERADEPEHALVELLSEPGEVDNNLLVAGCAPLLGVLTDRLGRHFADARATWLYADSSRALDLLARGFVHVAGVHLASEVDAEAHILAARSAFPNQRTTIINLARWRQGLVVAPGNPLSLGAGPALLQRELRRAVRPVGSGAQRVFERAAGDPEAMRRTPYDRMAGDHAEVARLVRWGLADVGVAIESVALAEGLTFIPLSEERFDLLIPESRLDSPAVARFVDLIDRPLFRAEAAHMPGYDLSLAGHVSTVSGMEG